MGTEPDYETIDFKLPSDLVQRLSTPSLLRALEAAWLDAFCRGMECGMHLIQNARKVVAENKKPKRRKKPKGKRPV